MKDDEINPFDDSASNSNSESSTRAKRKHQIDPDRFISVLSRQTQSQYLSSLPQPNSVYITPPSLSPTRSVAKELMTPENKRTASLFPTPTSIDPTLFYASSSLKLTSLKFSSLLSPTKRYVKKRAISKTPDLILDAPDVRDDYYTSLLAWSQTGNLMVGLGGTCYLWNTGLLETVCDSIESNVYVNGVAFEQGGKQGIVCYENEGLRVFGFEGSVVKEKGRIVMEDAATVIFRDRGDVVVGDVLGNLHFFDPRESNQVAHRRLGGFHLDRVVGMACQENMPGRLMATGCNGNIVNVWDERRNDKPLHRIYSHKSAIKALAFCPWDNTLLLTGGGLEDGSIQLQCLLTGKTIGRTDSDSQVCGLVFSNHFKEFVSAHNREESQLVIWDLKKSRDDGLYSMEPKKSLIGHRKRPMHLVISPDGQTIASLGDDEQLKFWRCFEIEKGMKRLGLNKIDGKSVTIR